MTSAGAPLPGVFGARLRALLETMDAAVVETLVELGLSDYRPRFSAVVRAVRADGPSSIGSIAARLAVTHSAASQTVTEMARRGLVRVEPGADARRRLVRLTALTESLLPSIDAEWDATVAALEEVNAELSTPLTVISAELAAALERKPFRQRIAEHLAAPAERA